VPPKQLIRGDERRGAECHESWKIPVKARRLIANLGMVSMVCLMVYVGAFAISPLPIFGLLIS
jgi:hypothetical protein